jgi:hypothetical protein
MDFINARKFHPSDNKCIEIRKKMFRHNFYLLLFLMVLGHFTLLTWYIFPLLEREIERFPLPQPMVVPIQFEIHYHIYWGVYLFICMAIYISSMLVGTGCLFLCSFMSFITAEFDVLAIKFESTIEEIRQNEAGGSSEESLKLSQEIICNMKQNIKQHHVLLKCADKIKKILYVPMLFQLLSSGILLR